MSRAGHVLRIAVATIGVSPLLLAGCAALSVDRPKEPIAQLLNRPRLARLAIAQIQYGNSAPFQVCAGDACPKPTNKTRASATQRSTTDAVVVPANLAPIAAPSLMPPATLFQAEASKPTVEPRPKTVMITFAFGAAMLTPAARKALDAVAPEARAAETIEIRGRTDELGSASLNDVLAQNRALAVRDYLHQKQLPEQTLIRVSFKGACCYVAANDTAEGRAANRRVEIEFTRIPRISCLHDGTQDATARLESHSRSGRDVSAPAKHSSIHDRSAPRPSLHRRCHRAPDVRRSLACAHREEGGG
jgi:outer membrane protein OmpA-like peptidoglycan-associated protein